MAAQTSYSRLTNTGFPGLLVDLNPKDIVSRSVETPAGIPFGVVVSRGTDRERQIVLGGTAPLGVSLRVLSQEGAANTGAVQWDVTDTAAVLREGYVFVVCPAGCTAGDAVKFTTATGVLDSGAAGAGEQALVGATWETTTAAGGVAVLRLS